MSAPGRAGPRIVVFGARGEETPVHAELVGQKALHLIHMARAGLPVPPGYMDFLFDAQGEDVVAGRRSGDDSEVLARSFPTLYRQIHDLRPRLERLFGDVQDVELTVQEGTLYLLQTRAAKRTPWAALRIACDMVDEGLIDEATAYRRLSGYELDSIVRLKLAADPVPEPVALGVPASGGMASGRVALDVDHARALAADGPVVLERESISTGDVGGMAASEGILTARGTRTSHGAVVARQLGKACVVGCRGLDVDDAVAGCRIGGTWFPAGATLTIDGGTGRVYEGELTTVVERPQALVERVRSWQERNRSQGGSSDEGGLEAGREEGCGG